MKICHILSHLGGGVGTVVRNWIIYEYKHKSENKHTVVTLESTNHFMEEFKSLNIPLVEDITLPALYKYIEDNDIVIMHWYNHPLLQNLMLNFVFPKCRLVIWSHSSANLAPYIHSERLIDFADIFVFTSPVSYHSQEVKELPQSVKDKISVVWSAFGSEEFNAEPRHHRGFNVGYTGTAAYTKLHKDYIKMSADVNVPDVKFIVCSSDSQKHLEEEARQQCVLEKFDFKGRVPSIKPILEYCDVFGYPIQEKSSHTCEQSIGEAMCAGVVPVVLNNPAEHYIIKDGADGIIANTSFEYSRAIEWLYTNPKRRKIMSLEAKEKALDIYSMRRQINTWNYLFETVMKKEKAYRTWDHEFGPPISSTVVFIESLGNVGLLFYKYLRVRDMKGDIESVKQELKELFRSNIQWQYEKKAGIQQYLSYFPEDTNLQEFNQILKESL